MVIFDIDGVILKFSERFSDYIYDNFKIYVSKDPIDWCMKDVEKNTKIPVDTLIHNFLASDYSKYIDIYTTSNMFNTDEIEISDLIKNNDILLTSIPNEFTIINNRQYCLESNNIYNKIFISYDKYSFIKKMIKRNHKIDLFIDDNPDTINKILKLGIKCAMPIRGYNYNKVESKKVLKYNNLNELSDILENVREK